MPPSAAAVVNPLAPADAPGLSAVAQVVSVAMPNPVPSPTQGAEAQALAHGAVQLKAQAQNFQVLGLHLLVLIFYHSCNNIMA